MSHTVPSSLPYRFSKLLDGLTALGQERQEEPLRFRVVEDTHLFDLVRVNNVVQRDRLKEGFQFPPSTNIQSQT